MGWVVMDDPESLHCEMLFRDDGRALGSILRFWEDGPTYAHTSAGRIGPCSPPGCTLEGAERGAACDAAARRSVERLAGLTEEQFRVATTPGLRKTMPP